MFILVIWNAFENRYKGWVIKFFMWKFFQTFSIKNLIFSENAGQTHLFLNWWFYDKFQGLFEWPLSFIVVITLAAY